MGDAMKVFSPSHRAHVQLFVSGRYERLTRIPSMVVLIKHIVEEMKGVTNLPSVLMEPETINSDEVLVYALYVKRVLAVRMCTLMVCYWE